MSKLFIMDRCLLNEILKVLFMCFKNNPDQLVSIFNSSNILAAFDVNLESTCIIQESHSIDSLLGGNHPIVSPHDERALDERVHPDDVCKYIQYFHAQPGNKTISHPEYMRFIFKKMQCQMKHSKGYWKPLTFVSFDYLEPESNTIRKYGFIANGQKEPFEPHIVNSSHMISGNSNKPILPLFDGDLNVTRREKEVLHLIGRGFIAKEIAINLHISTTTVISHRKNLISKFQVKNTAELIKQASKLMII